MALSARQQILYTHLCTLWRPTHNLTDGTPGDDTYTLVARGIKCFYEYTPNVDDPAEIGGFKRATIFTTDKIHFDVAQDVQNGDIAFNTSLNTDGTHGPNYGQVHSILGAPNKLPGSTNRQTNKQMVMAMQEEQVPEGVTA